MDWIYRNPEKHAAIIKRRLDREEANGGRGFDEEHWNELLTRCDGLCAYCRTRPAKYGDHYTPISRGGQHDFANMVPTCVRCNQRKGSADPVAWITREFGAHHVDYVRSIMLE